MSFAAFCRQQTLALANLLYGQFYVFATNIGTGGILFVGLRLSAHNSVPISVCCIVSASATLMQLSTDLLSSITVCHFGTFWMQPEIYCDVM